MDDISWWMYYAAAACSGISVAFTIFVAYVVMKTQAAIDQLETLILAVLDDALQIMVPTAVLNHISQYDIANFEMKTEGDKAKHLQKDICYAEDVSQPLSEKSQMYNDFGESGPQRKKLTARQMNQLQAAHSIEVLVKSPVKKVVTPARSTTNIALPGNSANKIDTKGSRTPETPEKKGSSDPKKSKENKPELIAKKSQLNLATAKEKPSKEKKETPSAQKIGTQTESKEKSNKQDTAKLVSKETPKDAPPPVAEKASAVKCNKKPSEFKLAKVPSKVEVKKSAVKISKKETGSNQSSTNSIPSKQDEVGGSKDKKESQKPTQMSEKSTYSDRTQQQEGEGGNKKM